MQYENLPGIIANYPEGGLTIQRTADFGDSVLIIGTAEDGPKNSPVPIHNLENLTDVFGRFGQGTLARGVYEAWNTTNTPIDIRAMRIGNGALGSLGIHEASGYITREFVNSDTDIYGARASGLADPTFSASGRVDRFIDALTLTAKYEGNRYNQFTLRQAFDDNANSDNYGRNCVLIYNPFTGEESSFSYDYYNTNNTAVDVHNITELVDAINADNNLNPYIGASTTDMTAIYEVLASGSVDMGYIVPSGSNDIPTGDIPQALTEGNAITTQWNTDGTPKKVSLFLHHITTSLDNNDDGIPDAVLVPDPTYGIPSVIKVGPVGMTWGSNIGTAGNQLVDLLHVYEVATASGEILDVAGKDYANLARIPVNRNESQAPGSVTGNTIITTLGNSTTTSQYRQYVSNGLVGISTDGETSVFTFTARLEPDVHSFATTTTNIPNRTHENTDVGKIIPTRIYETINGVTSETRKPATLAWAGSTCTITFTDADELPSAGAIITIDYISVNGTLTEYNTRTALENTRGNANDFENYFVTGSRIYFGGPHDTDIMVSYNHKLNYDIPGDVSITNHNIGKIEFTNPNKVPRIDGAAGTRIGLNYSYRPEWISPSGTESLAGGANGTNMTNKEMKLALADGYTSIENYNVDIVVPMMAYMDSSVEDYSPETGILQEVNAGFHTQLATLLDRMAENVNETIGIIAVQPSPSNSLSDVATWVRRLTIPDSNDKLRGANYMPIFNSKWVQIVAGEPGFSAARLNIAGVDYWSTGEALYAGLIPSLAAQKSPTNEYVGRPLIGLRYKLSKGQLNDLVGGRYVCLMNKDNVGPVVVKGVTAAAIGSDYDKVTTLRIVKLVMKVVREVADPYIGDVNTAVMRQSLHTAINGALQKMTVPPNQAIRNYNFKITATAADQRSGNMNIELAIVPVFCTERIYVTVRLRNAI